MAEGDATQGRVQMSASTGRIVRAWLWVGLCVFVILGFSGEAFSGQETSRYITPFLRWVWPDISQATLREAHFLVRKLAHLTEYTLLAVLAFRALRFSLAVSALRVGLVTLALVLAVAGIDEARQSILPTRTGSFADVMLDFAGGAVGVVLIVALHRWLGIGAPVPRPREGA